MIKYVLIIILATVSLNFFATPVSAYDFFKGTAIDCSDPDAANSAVCKDKKGKTPITGSNGILYRITQIVAILSGFAAVIMTVIAGIKYITSRGESSNVAAAKNTLVGVVAGLIIVAIAASIITFVIGRVT